MHEEDVDPVQPEAAETLFHRAHDAIIAVVEFGPLCRCALVVIVLRRCGAGWPQQPADLGRHGKGFALPVAQKTSQAALRQTKAIKRRRVEIANAQRPGAFNRGFRVGVTDGCEQSAERSRSQTHDRDVKRARKPRPLHSNYPSAVRSRASPLPLAYPQAGEANAGAPGPQAPTSTVEPHCPWSRGRGRCRRSPAPSGLS